MSDDIETVVRRYYAAVAALDVPEEVVQALLAPDLRVVEHPNPITPLGAVRTRAEVLDALRAGRGLLAEQRFDVHEVVEVGDRAAARVTWTGVVGTDRGPLTAGTTLTAEVASFLTVRDGCIAEQETFDCYAPFGA